MIRACTKITDPFSLRISILFAVLGFFSACGKMNSEPATRPTTDESAQQAKISKKSEFLISITKADGTSAVLGDNLYRVRVVRAQSLELLSNAAQVKFVYRMPEMPGMGTDEVAADKNADGSFEASLFYSMVGHWEVMVKIEDNNTQDDYVFSLFL